MGLRNDPPARADGEVASAWPGDTVQTPAADRLKSWTAAASGIPLAVTLAIFTLAFLVPAWPWLSGAVTIPWDAKSQFYPQVQFLAGSIARGEWPWWSPNVFAGWTQISDPQSLLFSPLHVVLAAFNSAISLRAFDGVTFAYLFLGGLGIILFFRDRGWHMGGALVAAMAFALGGAANARLQHTGQVISLAYLPLALWLIARTLERTSWRAGVAAGVICGLMAIGRDQVALLSLYVVAGFVLAFWVTGEAPLARVRVSYQAVGGRRRERRAGCRDPGDHVGAAGGALEPARGQFRIGGRGLDPPGAPAAIRLCRSLRCDGPEN